MLINIRLRISNVQSYMWIVS